MNTLACLRKKISSIIEKKESLFNHSVDIQRKYISKLNEPRDDIERSFNQYKCQMKLYGVTLKVLSNVCSFFINPVYLIKLSSYKNVQQLENVDAIAFLDGKPSNIIPDCVSDKYKNVKCFSSYDGYALNSKDIKFIITILRRHPLSWFFIFKCMMKIAKYSKVIAQYNPKAIIVCGEYSYTSSILTSYCELYCVKHINVMHGEKLYYIRDSFFRYHECYIWNEYYRVLFRELRAEDKQFKVAIPKSLSFAVSNVEKKYDYTYYLAAENKDELVNIEGNMKNLRYKGYSVSIRPHPRYTDLEMAKSIFKEYNIEDGRQVTIETSILSTNCAVSLYSTVLNQAYYNNIEIMIDDLSNPKKYGKLKKMKYFFLNVNHKLLSNEVKSYEIN